MKTIQDVEVGDEIVMVYRTGRRLDGKSSDTVTRGVVTEAKRVNLWIAGVDDSRVGWNVRRDTGKENGNRSMYGWHAYAVNQYEALQREGDAWTFLRDQGININSGSPWSGRKIELANLIRAYLETEVNSQ